MREHRNYIFGNGCVSIIEKPVKVRHGPATVRKSESDMSLGNWEGRRSYEAKSGELPIHRSPFDLRAIGRRIIESFLYVSYEKVFFVHTIYILML